MLSLPLPAVVLCFACVLADQQPADSCDPEDDAHALLQQQQLMADDGSGESAASEDEDTWAVHEQETDNVSQKLEDYSPKYHRKKCTVDLPDFHDTIHLEGKVLAVSGLDHALEPDGTGKAETRKAEVTFEKANGRRRRKSKSHSSLFITKVSFQVKDSGTKIALNFLLLCSLDVPDQEVYYPSHGKCHYQTAKCNSGAYTIKERRGSAGFPRKDIASGDITWQLGDDCKVAGVRVRVWGQDSVEIPEIGRRVNNPTQQAEAVLETPDFREDCNLDADKKPSQNYGQKYSGWSYGKGYYRK